MTPRQWSATLGAAVLLVVTLLPVPVPVRAVAGVLFVVLVPGLAVRAALIGGRGPAGERAVVAIAAGLSVAGLGGLLLALVGGLGRWQFLLLETAAAAVAGIAALRRSSSATDPSERRPPIGSWAVAVGTVAAVVVVVVVSLAFAQDAASARAQAQRNSVALAAVRKGSQLELQVIAGGTMSFSGSVSLGSPGATPMTWPVPALAPGATWSVDVTPPPGALRATLESQRIELRSLSIAPVPDTESGTP
jgi:hypothetical protein